MDKPTSALVTPGFVMQSMTPSTSSGTDLRTPTPIPTVPFPRTIGFTEPVRRITTKPTSLPDLFCEEKHPGEIGTGLKETPKNKSAKNERAKKHVKGKYKYTRAQALRDLNEDGFDESCIDDDYDPEEAAAVLFGIGYDDLGFPVEYRKEMSVSIDHFWVTNSICGTLRWKYTVRGEVATVVGDWPVIRYRNQPKTRTIAPDVMVIKGIAIPEEPAKTAKGLQSRRSYRVWEYGGKIPDFAIEIASWRTWRHDISRLPNGKLTKYEEAGIAEVVAYDYGQNYLNPPLQMWRNIDGKLVEVKPDERGRFMSEQLDLELGLEGDELCFYDASGARLMAPEVLLEQEQEKREAEQARAESEREQKEAALRTVEAERNRAEAERNRAETEREQKEKALMRENEAGARAEAERELKEKALKREEEERARADDERNRADDERNRADDERNRADDERRAKESAFEMMAKEQARVLQLAARLAELEAQLSSKHMAE